MSVVIKDLFGVWEMYFFRAGLGIVNCGFWRSIDNVIRNPGFLGITENCCDDLSGEHSNYEHGYISFLHVEKSVCRPLS